MVEITTEFQKSQYAALYQKLTMICSKKILTKAIYRASRRAATAGAAAVRKEISTLTTMKSTTVGESVKEYTYGSPAMNFAIGIKISDRPHPISDFKFKPKAPRYGAIPVTEIYKGKILALNNSVFVQKMPSGHISIFRRVSKNRLPIRELVGPSITGLFNANESIQDAVWDKIFETLDKRFAAELNYALNIENK